ncbi:LexA family protein [Alysiella crassa]|uniref:Uncharacterized HTH-type transcriptional regulator CBU_1416 n=1 Tax=Alysiella crassa TaxID=153491 RepID=A0A376BTR6_9NEIS|nr:S24 family peptidase [Alysiella crassa]UOP05894.1 hypothetical protein LVJ80_08365 [Alysiella crassa]SSY80319.1 Uncharacterized HTH-type transcriptional regulator CBU_1416 [Alysiella crassa]
MSTQKISVAGKNLAYLMERQGFNATSLVAEIKKENPNSKANQPTLFRIITGETEDPKETSLQPFADYFGVEVADLRMRDLTTASHSNTLPIMGLHGRIPIIDWKNIQDWISMEHNAITIQEWRSTTRRHGKNTFALRVAGISMLNYGHRESFEDNDVILVDPDKTAVNGSLVIVQIDDTKGFTFRKLYIEGDKMYLYALNPNWNPLIMELNDFSMIKGVVFEKQVDF